MESLYAHVTYGKTSYENSSPRKPPGLDETSFTVPRVLGNPMETSDTSATTIGPAPQNFSIQQVMGFSTPRFPNFPLNAKRDNHPFYPSLQQFRQMNWNRDRPPSFTAEGKPASSQDDSSTCSDEGLRGYK